jgi:hypothetical protein
MNSKFTLLTLFCLSSVFSLAAEQKNDSISPFKISADIVSSYVWRGSLATSSPTPNIQPTISYTKGNFEIGVWGSTDFTGTYKEIDAYMALTVSKLKFTVSDYDWSFNKAAYFDFNNNTTGHIFEASVVYSGSKTFPLSIGWNTMFYGFDKKQNGDAVEQAYSSYVELGYTKGSTSFFFGFSPWESYYSAYRKGFEVVNMGISVTKELKITDQFSLPVKSSFIVNPSGGYTQSDYVHLTIGITL